MRRSSHGQSHALFTKPLLHVLTETAAKLQSDVRIINVTSDIHVPVPHPSGLLPETCLNDMSRFLIWTRYRQSKLCNILLTTELARRYPNIASSHPARWRSNESHSFSRGSPLPHHDGRASIEALRNAGKHCRLELDVDSCCTCGGQGIDNGEVERRSPCRRGNKWGILYANREGERPSPVGGGP